MLKTYKSPRVGIIPLCEYQAASAVRRTTIIKNAKDVPVYIAKRYEKAEHFLANFLTSQGESRHLTDYINTLRTDAYKSKFEEDCGHSSADSLSAFHQNGLWVTTLLNSFGLYCSINDHSNKMIVNGVQISFRPEIILRDKDGRQQLGFVKLYFSKTKPLSESSATLITCVGKHYYELEQGLVLQAKNCLILDVFRGTLFDAPKAHKRRLNEVLASCKEIADRWDLID